MDKRGKCSIASNKASAFYYTTIGVLTLAVLAGYIFIASRSFFFQDDFLFLLPDVFKQLRVFPDMAEVHLFRPLSKELFYLLTYHFFDMESFYFFLINITAHILSAGCLFFILVKLRLRRKLSALIVFLFFSNVAAFEKMSWVAYFQHTSYQLFLFLSLLFALLSIEKYGVKRAVFIFLSATCWIFCLLSNIAGIFFPIILLMLLFIKLKGDGTEKSKKIVSTLMRTTFTHWIVLLLYVALIFLPHWKRTDISDPYYVDLSITTFFNNLSQYLRGALFTDANRLFLIPLSIVYLIFVIPQVIKKFFAHKSPLIHILMLLLIFGCLYAPFAFLKYQTQVYYVSLALIPWYVLIFYPFFDNSILQGTFPRLRRVLIILSVFVLTASFLPGKKQLLNYFEYSPRLHIKSVWNQMELLVPRIPEGTQKIVFIDQETFEHEKNVPIWSIPPFWWHVGHGAMFAILYRRLDVKFDVAPAKPLNREPNAIYLMVNKGPVYYSLSLLR